MKNLHQCPRIFTVLLLCIMFYFPLAGQQIGNIAKLDSVFLKGKKVGLEGNVDQSYQLFLEAQQIAMLENNAKWLSKIQVELGKIHYNWGEYDISLKYFLEALTIATDNHHTETRSEALNYIGKYYHTTGDFEKSYKYYLRSLKLAEQIKDTVRIAFVSNNIGKHFSDYGEHSKSLEYYLEAYDLQKEKILDKEVFATTCNHLGNLYNELEDYQKSLRFHFESLKNRSSINYVEGIGKSYLNISKLYYEMGEIDSSAKYSVKALELFQRVGYAKGKTKCYNQLGYVHFHYGKLDDAQTYFTRSFNLANQITYDKGILNAKLPLAQIHLQQRSYSKALDFYQQCLVMAFDQNKKEAIRDSYFGIKKTYEAIGDFKSANSASNNYIRVSEELIKDEYSKQIANLNVAFETERKEKQNDLLRSENQLKTLQLKKRNLLILFFVSSLVFVSIIAVVTANKNSKKRKANQKLKELNDELISVNKEKDKFFSIIAHELRNPLWWFKNITETLSKNFGKMSQEDMSDSLRTMDESAKNTFLLMDNLLNWTRSKMGIISCKPAQTDINELVQQNIQLFEMMLVYKKIDLKTNLEENVWAFADSNLTNSVVRNVLSNAIKFTPGKGNITITTQQKNGESIIQIEDSGIGIDNEVINALFDEKKTYSTLGLMQEKGSGLGLKLCKEFITMNNGDFEIKSEKDVGTQIRITLPGYRENRNTLAGPVVKEHELQD